MLKIFYGEMPEAIYNTAMYFDNIFESEWITSDLAKEIIEDVDKSKVLNGNCIESPVFGQIPPTSLSGGTKTLLLMLNDLEQVFNASTCGDNCAKWLLRLAKNRDLTINLRHFMNFGTLEFKIEVLNNNQVVNNMKDCCL